MVFVAWLSLVSFCHPLLIKAIVPCVVISRCERLEEQLNDLTELHQNEILNLKQELASMEEKIAYQSYERARDIQVGDRSKDPSPALCLLPSRTHSLLKYACASIFDFNPCSFIAKLLHSKRSLFHL